MVNFFPVTGDYLRGIFTDLLFGKKLEQIIAYDLENFESSLDAYQMFQEPRYELQNIELGFSDRVDKESIEVSTEGLITFDTLLPFEESFSSKEWVDYYLLISLHNHPGGSFMPSNSDLFGLNKRKINLTRVTGISVKPIEAIISKNKKGRYNLLAFQELATRAVDEMGVEELHEEIFNQVSDDFDPYLVFDALKNQERYKAEILTLNKNNSFSKRDLEKLSNFEFTPQIADLERYEEMSQWWQKIIRGEVI